MIAFALVWLAGWMVAWLFLMRLWLHALWRRRGRHATFSEIFLCVLAPYFITLFLWPFFPLALLYRALVFGRSFAADVIREVRSLQRLARKSGA